MSKRKTDIMITIEKAYEKFYKLLEQIDNSDIPPSEQYELYLKLNRKSNKRMQICMNIDKGDFHNGK